MGLRTVKLRRLLGTTALCGGMAIAATGIGAGIADAAPWGPAAAPSRPGGLGAATAATDVGTASSATDVGTASSAASLYPVPSLLTD
jgi:hypothetical protein